MTLKSLWSRCYKRPKRLGLIFKGTEESISVTTTVLLHCLESVPRHVVYCTLTLHENIKYLQYHHCCNLLCVKPICNILKTNFVNDQNSEVEPQIFLRLLLTWNCKRLCFCKPRMSLLYLQREDSAIAQNREKTNTGPYPHIRVVKHRQTVPLNSLILKHQVWTVILKTVWSTVTVRSSFNDIMIF